MARRPDLDTPRRADPEPAEQPARPEPRPALARDALRPARGLVTAAALAAPFWALLWRAVRGPR